MDTVMIFRQLFVGYLLCATAWLRLRRRPTVLSAALPGSYVIYAGIPFVILLSGAITSIAMDDTVDWAFVLLFGAMAVFGFVYGIGHPNMHVYNIDLELVRETMQWVRPCTWEFVPAVAPLEDELYAKASPRWYRVKLEGTGYMLRTSPVRNDDSMMLAPDGEWESDVWQAFVREYARAIQKQVGKPNYKIGLTVLVMGCFLLGVAIIGMVM